MKNAAKRNYFENLFREVNNSSDTWKYINQLLRKNKPTFTIPPAISVNGITISSSQQICNKMNKHFVEIGKKLSSKANFHNDKNYNKFLDDRQRSLIYLRPLMNMKLLK